MGSAADISSHEMLAPAPSDAGTTPQALASKRVSLAGRAVVARKGRKAFFKAEPGVDVGKPRSSVGGGAGGGLLKQTLGE